jgi:hypothetical protein
MLLKELLEPIINLGLSLYNSTLWIASCIIGVLLSAIGYPKEVVLFILILTFIDIITKLYSLTIINSCCFSFYNFFKTWLKDRIISSNDMKNGIFAKCCIYGVFLFSANYLVICQNNVWYAIAISNTIYTAMILLELSSVLENFSDCGYKKFDPFLDFFKRKQKEILKKK